MTQNIENKILNDVNSSHKFTLMYALEFAMDGL